jgi:enoyl-CoA hydratase/carnithine racemase
LSNGSRRKVLMSVLFETTDGIAVLTLNRPEKRNAMTREMYQEISNLLRRIDEDESIRAGVITGAGGDAFSAGADLIGVHTTAETAGDQQWTAWRASRFDSGIEVQKPLIAAVEGYCLAGGLELALSCDIRVAGQGSQFGTPEVKWNLLHGFGAQLLPQVIGTSNALYLLLTGMFISADEAHRMGLVQEVTQRGAALARAKELARLISENAPVAVRMTKELVHRSRNLPLADGLRLYHAFSSIVEASDDLKEGTAAFAERRRPQFTGH